MTTVTHYDTKNWIGGVKPMPLWLAITTILIGSVCCVWQFIIFSKGSTFMDGYSYFDAWETIKGFHTDTLRTPVYAIFVGLLKEIFGKETALRIIPVIQWMIYISSMQLMWQINLQLGIRRGLNVTIILLLMLIPGFWCFNNITMAESFSTCGMILLTWLSIKYRTTSHTAYLIASGVTVTLLIFTKPMFVFLLPLMAIFWIVISRKNTTQLLWSIALLLSSSGLVGTYLYLMNHTYTVAGMTIASSWNRFYCLRADGLIIPDEIQNPELRERFRPMYDSVPGGWLKTQPYWQDIYALNWPEIETLNTTAMRNHPKETFLGVIRRFKAASTQSQFHSLDAELGLSPEYDRDVAGWDGMSFNRQGGYIYPLHHYLWLPIWTGWAILFVYSAYWICRWCSTKRFPALPFFIASTV